MSVERLAPVDAAVVVAVGLPSVRPVAAVVEVGVAVAWPTGFPPRDKPPEVVVLTPPTMYKQGVQQQGSHRLWITGYNVFSRHFKVSNNNSQGYISRHSPPSQHLEVY